MSSFDEAPPVPTIAATTIKSLDNLHTHLPPTVPAHYLTHHVVQTLLRKGFHGAEAGALTEIERLLEHHIQSLFTGSKDYARLAGRVTPNAFDVLKARDEIKYSSIRRMRREGKRRRKGIKLELEHEVPPPERPITLQDLPPLRPPVDKKGEVEGTDRKPDLTKLGTGTGTGMQKDKDKEEDNGLGIKPVYGFEGGPSLPPRWTYPSQSAEAVMDDSPIGQITKRSLDFVKMTASERGDIPAELGVVNFRKSRKRGAAGTGT